MATKKPHQLDRLAQQVDAELDGQAERLYPRLEAELFDDAEHLGEPRFVEHVRAQAAVDPEYLTQVYERIGPRAFNRLWEQAFEKPLHAGATEADHAGGE